MTFVLIMLVFFAVETRKGWEYLDGKYKMLESNKALKLIAAYFVGGFYGIINLFVFIFNLLGI